jgi:hypothetical protein
MEKHYASYRTRSLYRYYGYFGTPGGLTRVTAPAGAVQFLIKWILLAGSILIPSGLSAQTEGPYDGNTFQNVSIPGSSVSWVNATDAKTLDGFLSSAGDISGAGNFSDYLSVTNFSFAVPVDKIITGIEVIAYKSSTNDPHTKDYEVRLIKNGNVSGDNKALNASWQGQSVPAVYGGNGDLWGETWTPADINSPDFGAAIAVERSGSGTDPLVAYIDNIRIRVFYGIILPVRLTAFSFSFTGEKTVQLEWITASETNNDYFTLERSGDGKVFSEMDVIEGAGNTTVENKYVRVDSSRIPALRYYRLFQTDYDGRKEQLGNILCVNAEQPEVKCTLNVYPNPSGTNGKMLVSAAGFSGKSILLVVTDELGREFYSKVIPVNRDGSAVEVIDPEQKLTAGMYFVTGSNDDSFYRSKVIVR